VMNVVDTIIPSLMRSRGDPPGVRRGNACPFPALKAGCSPSCAPSGGAPPRPHASLRDNGVHQWDSGSSRFSCGPVLLGLWGTAKKRYPYTPKRGD
jgi:hypothetical protein